MLKPLFWDDVEGTKHKRTPECWHGTCESCLSDYEDYYRASYEGPGSPVWTYRQWRRKTDSMDASNARWWEWETRGGRRYVRYGVYRGLIRHTGHETKESRALNRERKAGRCERH